MRALGGEERHGGCHDDNAVNQRPQRIGVGRRIALMYRTGLDHIAHGLLEHAERIDPWLIFTIALPDQEIAALHKHQLVVGWILYTKIDICPAHRSQTPHWISCAGRSRHKLLAE